MREVIPVGAVMRVVSVKSDSKNHLRHTATVQARPEKKSGFRPMLRFQTVAAGAHEPVAAASRASVVPLHQNHSRYLHDLPTGDLTSTLSVGSCQRGDLPRALVPAAAGGQTSGATGTCCDHWVAACCHSAYRMRSRDQAGLIHALRCRTYPLQRLPLVRTYVFANEETLADSHLLRR